MTHDLSNQEFGDFAGVICARAAALGQKPAIVEGERSLSYAELGVLIDRIAVALVRDGVVHGDVVAICSTNSIEYAAVIFGALRASATFSPLSQGTTAEGLAAQLIDCSAKFLFADEETAKRLNDLTPLGLTIVTLPGLEANGSFEAWLAPPGSRMNATSPAPDDAFNIVYSSGTTGRPKGIVQSHSMRWSQARRGLHTPDSVNVIATALCSNTTLLSFLPTFFHGGTVILMAKFDIRTFLQVSERFKATQVTLVPIQYQRIMQDPTFGEYNLASYKTKYSTSAPLGASLKAEILRRWPGGLVEFYGMTEGGGTCALVCHEFPDKLGTVGRPLPGHDIRLIGVDDAEIGKGGVGEIVGRSPSMMAGYHNRAELSAEAEWRSPDGQRFIRTGDVGHFDEDGFLTLVGRKKDMIISGGFNIYPSDLEAEIGKHPDVLEAAVVGVPSVQWGEAPIAYVVLRNGAATSTAMIREYVNARVGKVQRLADVRPIAALPRNEIGKVLKRKLQDAYTDLKPERANKAG